MAENIAAAEGDYDAWAGIDSPVCREVETRARANVAAYKANPALLEEQRNIELATSEGGYGKRQLYELIQNGADALLTGGGGRIQILLTNDAFYCANEGDPIDVIGVRALLLSNVSAKRGDEIGRFGLGFKSVLEVTDSPQFFSRSGSFAWDYPRTVEAIAKAVKEFDPRVEAAPKLRLAWPVEPSASFAEDPVLSAMSEWATTIVKLPFTAGRPAWLRGQLAKFPREFLLFCRHVRQLELQTAIADDSEDGEVDRTITIETLAKPKGFYKLSEDDSSSTWAVFSTVHETSKAALADAGTMSRRERIPIHWAMPAAGLETQAGKVPRGRLWAFFETDYETTLSGIVNAPWKTNPDRKNLLEGEFNREVLRVVAELVIESLQRFRSKTDPGRLLDLIPARGDEAPNWADSELTERYYQLAAQSPSLPDMTGKLRLPADLTLHPRLKAAGEEGRAAIQELLQLWADAAPHSNWCHPTVERRERRSRAERLIRDGDGHLAGWPAWLEALVEKPTPSGSKAALRVAALAVAEGFVAGHAVEQAEIVLTANGKLVRPDPKELFFKSDYDAADEVDFVHPELADDPDARAALAQLGITSVDAAADLENLLRGSFATWTESDWESFWQVARRVGPERAAGVINARKKRPFARVQSARFRPIGSILLPGEIIPDDPDRDRDIVLDAEYHAPDIELLTALGVRPAPEPGGGSTDEAWFDQYKVDALVQFRHLLTGNRRPQEKLLDFINKRPFAGPLAALEWLSDEGRALMTDAALHAESDLGPWVFAHTTQPDSYPKLEMSAPTIWRLRDEGRFHTSRGLRPAALTVHPSLHEWAQFLPVAKCEPAVAALLGLPEALDALSDELWLEAVAASFEVADDTAVGRLYATACSHIDAPAMLRCRRRDGHAAEPPELVSAVASTTEFEALVAQDVPTILAPTVEDADALRARWGLNTEQKVETNLAYGVAGAEAPLTDRFPSLQWQLEPEQRDLMLVPCSELRLETITASGRTADNLTVHLDDGRIFYDEQLDERTLLLSLAPLLDLELDEQDADVAIAKRRDVERRRRIEEIKKQSTPEERLLAALGEAPLRSRLPRGLLGALEADGRVLEGREIAELALAVYGVDVLRVFRSELEEAGLEPPRQWAGSQAALTYVRRIGFPREFAGFEHPRRSPLLEVEGPPNVPDLHTYQRQIVDGLRSLLRGDLDGQRAMISLPTGAGKTRVAVEAIIEAFQHDGLTGPILWVAQSDELCEQAVQTWSFVWRGLGPAREPLAISRLWGSNEVEPSETAAHVVVAGIQKLQAGCIKDPEYAWLAEASCVVIDEAHHSTAPSYTELLDWLGLGRQKQSRPLVGLTATPYRGVSEVETDRLVKRYGTRRLDSIAFADENPYPILQREGVLAGVEHRLMKGTDVVLDAKELDQIRRLRVLPPRAEEELGRSVDRNRRLLAEVLRLPEDWTVLLFATSVDHAQTMAALLTLEGVTAKPITGLTDDGPRRHYIEEFREGRIRVLTNYNVLTQGFDAPAVRAVIVARPTFSPNLYQQMIGRGLRGPLNGGKETCLIVNVEDNVVAYGDDLAFREFEYLWSQDGGTR